MRTMCLALLLCGSTSASESSNPLIDEVQFLADASAAMDERAQRRIDQETFAQMAAEPGTVVLDARSAQAYALTHVKGAINLPFTDFTAQTLAQHIPSPQTRVLIYCNNNFLDSPRAFATKAPAASLNLSTFTALRSYGYQNVYELGELISVHQSRLELVGAERQ